MKPLIALVLLCSLPLVAGADPAPDFTYIDPHGEIAHGVRCGAPDPGSYAPLAPTGRFDRAARAREKAPVTIPVAFHSLIYYSQREGGYVGEITEQQVADQVAVLNAAYLDMGFQFRLLGIDVTDDKAWATMRPGSTDEFECKAALAVDPASTLNIYVCSPGGGLLGWSFFPDQFPEDHTMHGTVIHWGTLPGSGYPWPYDLGDTATHEIGHYCGLYHTFQDGCTEPNDWCADTPQEASASYGCPHDQDSCPNDPGLDPIYNFMDYTDDDCMDHFTYDQGQRMAEMMSLHRPTIMNSMVSVDPGDGTAASAGTRITAVRPNPFNPRTLVSFHLERAGRATVKLYDVAGRLVRVVADGAMEAGDRSVELDGSGLPSAVYFLTLETDGNRATRRLAILK